MKYNPKIHHRRSIRLKGYDYSRAGLYFLTICCQGRVAYFGNIDKGVLQLNEAGKMIEKWYHELENKYHDIQCHEMVVMPNHFHCIIENVGADLRVRPNNEMGEFGANEKPNKGEHVGSPQPGSPQPAGSPQPGSPQPNSPQPEPTSLSTVVQWFKTMTTNEYIRGVKTLGWQRFDGKLWQRNYWEHIIRNDHSYHRISNYIIDNPKKWDQDKFYQQ